MFDLRWGVAYRHSPPGADAFDVHISVPTRPPELLQSVLDLIEPSNVTCLELVLIFVVCINLDLKLHVIFQVEPHVLQVDLASSKSLHNVPGLHPGPHELILATSAKETKACTRVITCGVVHGGQLSSSRPSLRIRDVLADLVLDDDFDTLIFKL